MSFARAAGPIHRREAYAGRCGAPATPDRAAARVPGPATDRLVGDGGQEGPCGWLKDTYGLSWQVVPAAATTDLIAGPDQARVGRAMKAMSTMKKPDPAALLAAADGK
ncbi:hypothetical protein GCM10023082_37040 [Streptomyces tremellae]|uniref:PhnB-like domain-containing protein n=1 Tax=Streptomyces tremellae TaxID=1124239 RepID=A0ABP7FD47_9ACTN